MYLITDATTPEKNELNDETSFNDLKKSQFVY